MTEPNGNGEKKKVKELVSISIILFEDFDGDTCLSEKYLQKEKLGFESDNKYTFTLPIPRTDEEAHALCGCPLSELTRKGVIQKFYGETAVTNLFHEKVKGGVDPSDEDLLVALKAEAETFLKTPAEAKGQAAKAKVAEAKGVIAARESAGLSNAEILAIIKEAGAKKAAEKAEAELLEE